MSLTIAEKKSCLNRNMNIIALQGRSNTGKTQCLQKLIYEINKNTNISWAKPEKSSKFDELLQNGISFTKRNYLTDFVVCGKIGDKTIAIITYGDNEASLVSGFYSLRDNPCDLYICACRTHGETVNFLEELTLKGKLIIHSRWSVSEEKYQEITMKSQVKELESEIKELLK